MRKILLAAALALMAVTSATAQKRGEVVFEEASARELHPNVNMFLFPQICDLKMISTDRVNYGPFTMPMAKDLGSMTNGELENMKSIALQRACALDGADLIIEPLYTSTVYDSNLKAVVITLSGYPAKYVNFRSLTSADLDMIRTLYPNGIGNTQRKNDEHIVTAGVSKSK